MKTIIILLIHLSLYNLSFAQEKYVTITMDDLFYAFDGSSIDKIENASDSLLYSITKLNIPVTVFVNEKSLIKEGETDRRLSLLKKWVSNPQVTIGNHTYSHINYADTTLSAFEDDIIQGEALTKELLKKENKKLKYFRFPFNCTGKDSISKAEIYDFLNHRGYVIAPFTIESSDYMYNALYTKYIKEGNTKAANEIIEEYIGFTIKLFQFFDEAANKIFGRNIRQIYLCHTNLLNAASFNKLINTLKQQGYSFISLNKTLDDKIYQSKDYYFQKFGISWFYRWIKNKDERIKLMRQEPEDTNIEERYNKLAD